VVVVGGIDGILVLGFGSVLPVLNVLCAGGLMSKVKLVIFDFLFDVLMVLKAGQLEFVID